MEPVQHPELKPIDSDHDAVGDAVRCVNCGQETSLELLKGWNPSWDGASPLPFTCSCGSKFVVTPDAPPAPAVEEPAHEEAKHEDKPQA